MPFDTSLLDGALAERAAALEQDRRRLLAAAVAALDDFGPRFGWQQAFLFGSVTLAGRFHQGSDIDIAVSGLNPIDRFQASALFSERLGFQVDLVPLEQLHFAQRIRQKGIPWVRTTPR